MTYGYVLISLADPTRRQLLEHLASGPLSVGEIADLMPVSRPAVSQHLSHLKLAGLVLEERQGTRRIYRIDPSGLMELRQWIDDLWGTALNNLKALAEARHEH
jgi:DNA-binding transcriptional ArsR family regulator